MSSPGRAVLRPECFDDVRGVLLDESEFPMEDMMYLAATVALFAVALLYTAGCDRLKGRKP